MANIRYNRSEILNFAELTEKQQQDVLSCYYQDTADAEQDSFVIFESKKSAEFNAALPLSQFMRIDGKSIWNGVFGTSYFSAYFIKLSRCGTAAVIAEKYI